MPNYQFSDVERREMKADILRLYKKYYMNPIQRTIQQRLRDEDTNQQPEGSSIMSQAATAALTKTSLMGGVKATTSAQRGEGNKKVAGPAPKMPQKTEAKQKKATAPVNEVGIKLGTQVETMYDAFKAGKFTADQIAARVAAKHKKKGYPAGSVLATAKYLSAKKIPVVVNDKGIISLKRSK